MVDTPAWLAAKVDQLIARVEHQIPPEAYAGALVMLPLAEPEPGVDFDRWDRTCDNCGTYVPGDGFFSISSQRHLSNGTPVIITAGTCRRCKELP